MPRLSPVCLQLCFALLCYFFKLYRPMHMLTIVDVVGIEGGCVSIMASRSRLQKIGTKVFGRIRLYCHVHAIFKSFCHTTVMIRTLKDTHNHPTGEPEFRLYASERRPDEELRNTAATLLSHGANPTLVTQFLNDNNAPVRPRDVHNLKHKLNFRGTVY